MFLNNSEIRSKSKKDLSGRWGLGVLITFVYMIFSTIFIYIPVIGPSLLIPPILLGFTKCFMGISEKKEVEVKEIFSGFSNFGRIVWTNILIGFYIVMWFILLIVPGIIAIYKYAMTFYIINDNSNMKANEAIAESKRIMDGHKFRLFQLEFSLIGWALLSILTLGIGFMWFIPYRSVAVANFYQGIKES